jgi:hypothetical protein
MTKAFFIKEPVTEWQMFDDNDQIMALVQLAVPVSVETEMFVGDLVAKAVLEIKTRIMNETTAAKAEGAKPETAINR